MQQGVIIQVEFDLASEIVILISKENNYNNIFLLNYKDIVPTT